MRNTKAEEFTRISKLNQKSRFQYDSLGHFVSIERVAMSLKKAFVELTSRLQLSVVCP